MNRQRILAHRVDGAASAPPLVLIHPIATNSDIWAAQVAVWSSMFRVIRIDLPGHGASDPPIQSMSFNDYASNVCEVLDSLSVKKAAVVGLSLGGMVAQALALGWPDRVTALVLAHTSARTDPAVFSVWRTRLEQFQAQGQRMDAVVASTLERWFTRDFAASAPLAIEFVAAQIRSTSAIGYETAVRAIQGLDHLDRLAEILVPTLVVAGSEDSAVPPAAASLLASRITGAQLAVLDGAAHIGNVQQPVQFTETVGEFLLRSHMHQPMRH